MALVREELRFRFVGEFFAQVREVADLSSALRQDFPILPVDIHVGDVGISDHASYGGGQELFILRKDSQLTAIGKVAGHDLAALPELFFD